MRGPPPRSLAGYLPPMPVARAALDPPRAPVQGRSPPVFAPCAALLLGLVGCGSATAGWGDIRASRVHDGIEVLPWREFLARLWDGQIVS